MNTPTSTLISRAIESRLKGISSTNGYHTDVGLRVFRGRAALYQDSVEKPYVSIVSIDDEVIEGSLKRAVCQRDYNIIITLAADGNYDEDQDALLFDVRKALANDVPTHLLDGHAATLDIGTAQLDDPELGHEDVQIIIPITVTYGQVYN